MSEGHAATEITSREQKRQRILRAAIEVFARKGYFAARMTDIAKSADVADGTLYLYFDGKEDLLISVFDDVMSQFVARAQAEIDGIDDPLAKLDALLRLHLETLGSDRDLAHVLQIETRHSRRFMNLFTRGHLGEYLELMRTIIEEGQRTGVLRSDVGSGLTINFVFGAVDELVTSWLLAEEPGDLARQRDALLRLLSEGMLAQGNPRRL